MGLLDFINTIFSFILWLFWIISIIFLLPVAFLDFINYPIIRSIGGPWNSIHHRNASQVSRPNPDTRRMGGMGKISCFLAGFLGSDLVFHYLLPSPEPGHYVTVT